MCVGATAFDNIVVQSLSRELHYTRLPCLHYLWSLLKLMSIESVMPYNHLILCCPLLLLPSTFPSIRVSSNEWALRIRWPKYWSFSISINPSNEYSELISFRIDWFDLLEVQGILIGLTGLISLKSKGFSRVFSNITVWKHLFFDAQPPLCSNSQIPTWLLEKL